MHIKRCSMHPFLLLRRKKIGCGQGGFYDDFPNTPHPSVGVILPPPLQISKPAPALFAELHINLTDRFVARLTLRAQKHAIIPSKREN